MIFRELYRIEFLFLSARGWRINVIEELYRIEFLFIIYDGLILFLLINFEIYNLLHGLNYACRNHVYLIQFNDTLWNY